MSVSHARNGDLNHWRAKAEGIERELYAITEALIAAGPSHPHHIHHLFAELYLSTTRCWLARLSRRDDSEYAYRVICHFLQLYRDQVLERMDHPLENIAAHWHRYHQMARRQTIQSPISAHLVLISVGARAHTHGDLGRAMCMAEEDLGHPREACSALQADRKKIFGQISDEAFYHAALDYVTLHRARQTGWRSWILGLYRMGLFVLKPVWLPVFQRWRRTGYAEAVAALDAQRTVPSELSEAPSPCHPSGLHRTHRG
ncbi:MULTISPECIES: hypothetical protein [Roseobacteraceae]|uniref:hypothetical protein n=1 Tax=Roseobacteraceae TaxID=2854170 RepID=UPI002B276DBB|nr:MULTISPECIES: hypothetical protein [Roseobacteraceae]